MLSRCVTSVSASVCATWLCATALLLALTVCAFAHAALVRAEPADGAVLRQAPAVLRLTFNEPVSPLVVRLFAPDGEPIALGAITATNALVSIVAPKLRRGTHVLSWRVISADGHPVGGTVIFSVGAPSGQVADAVAQSDRSVALSLWIARVLLYVGLVVGAGGAFFCSWNNAPAAAGESWLSGVLLSLLALGLVAVSISVGLQGIDALDLPLAGLKSQSAWQTGIDTSYGLTAMTAAAAFLASIFSLAVKSSGTARALSLAGLLGAGLALSLSGHAGSAWPQIVNRPALFLHVACISFWIGSLLPLYKCVRAGSGSGPELKSFTRAIPLPLAIVIVSGAWLAFVQVVHLDSLSTTHYGQVLLCKLAAVAALLSLAALNRYLLVPRQESGDMVAARLLNKSMALEIGLALAILGLVALWRFTPPPRALADALPVSVHLHGEKAMTDITFERAGKNRAVANMTVLDGDFQPLAAKEVVLVLANSPAGFERTRRVAVRTGENTWRIEDLRVPVSGRWSLSVEVLISDFEKVMVEDAVTLPRVP